MTLNTPSHRNRGRRAVDPLQQHDVSFPSYASQPHPSMASPYEANKEHVQPSEDMIQFELTDVDFIMEDILNQLPVSAPLVGSPSHSFSGSWTNVDKSSSPSGWVLYDGSDDVVMIRNSQNQISQAYSTGSNAFFSFQTDTSPAFPMPEIENAGAWVHGGNLMVDNQALPGHQVSDRDFYLASLSINKPRTVHNNYEGYLVDNRNHVFDDTQTHNYVYSVPKPQMAIPRHGGVRTQSDHPWTPVEPQMSEFESGYVLNLPSPGPQGEVESDRGSRSRASSSEAHSPRRRSSKAGVKPRRAPNASVKSGKEKRKPVELSWEHAAFTKGGLSFVTETGQEEETHRNGIRKGPLDSVVAEKAKKMRQIGACWKCWIQKVPCSVGDTCERCEKLKQMSTYSPTADQLCCRQGFIDYAKLFFPTFLHRHLNKQVIEDLVSTHTSRFLDPSITVEISTGAAFTPMTIPANVFLPQTEELLRQSRLMAGNGSNVNTNLVVLDSLPIGIIGLSSSEMKQSCSDHIDAMLEAPGYVTQVCAGDQTTLAFQILKVMQRYARTEPIVHEALKLHAMHYFMSHLITFTAASVQNIVQHLSPVEFPSINLDQFPSSRLLSRQIKQIVHKLHVETTKRVLASVEKSLRKRTKDYWAPTFATILVLCLCMENLETAADTLVVCDKMRGDEAEGFGERDSAKTCRDLEDVPFAQCKNLLHEIYHSNKEATGGTRDAGFNPLKSLASRKRSGLEGEADVMVTEIIKIVHENWSEVSELARRGPVEDSEYEVEAGEIRAHNTGRLASNFLLSFFPDTFSPCMK